MEPEAWWQLLNDFDRLAAGQMPDGTKLLVGSDPMPWELALLFGQGDMLQLCQEWGMVHYNAPIECCGMCKANRTNRKITNLQEDAEWRPTTDMPNQAVYERDHIFADQKTICKLEPGSVLGRTERHTRSRRLCHYQSPCQQLKNRTQIAIGQRQI